MTLDELTAYLEKAGFTRTEQKPEEQKPDEQKPDEQKPEEQQNSFATKDDLTALQNSIAELTKTIKANAIASQFTDKPNGDSADDILASVLVGKTGGKDK